jgi:LmbE family N-acetylglucosaminyl deacetylase
MKHLRWTSPAAHHVAVFELGAPVLVLAAHMDDEFACAGTIARLTEAGTEVHLACFSAARESVPSGFDPDVLTREVRDASAVLGIPQERLTLFDYEVRQFPEHRQAILEDLIRLRDAVQPRTVLLPALRDIHQDHGVLAHEGLRAFKHGTILGYDMPQNGGVEFAHACFVRLEDRHVERKIEHAAAYRSQAGRPYFDPAYLRALARVRGLVIGVPNAESFDVVRLAII